MILACVTYPSVTVLLPVTLTVTYPPTFVLVIF